MKLRLFVISTIDRPDSDRRKHADAVLANVINPAGELLQREGVNQPGDVALEIVRGERDPSIKRITGRIVEAILGYELVTVVAFEDNGNVFYEAGIAHSAGRPLLLLKHDRYQMPFDLRDYPHIEYTDSDMANLEHASRPGGPAQQLAAAIRAQRRRPEPLYEKPFDRRDIGALGGEGLLERFRDFAYLEWSRMLLDARKEIWLAGISLWQLIDPNNTSFHLPVLPDGSLPEASNSNIINLIAFALARGVDVAIMMMDPANPALPGVLLKPMDFVDLMGTAEDEVRRQIEASFAEWTARLRHLSERAIPELQKKFAIAQPAGTWRVIKVRTGVIPQRITWTDRETITSPFFNNIPYNSGGPAVRARVGQPWHRMFHGELQLLAARNPPSTD